jgi:hypothetical protein
MEMLKVKKGLQLLIANVCIVIVERGILQGIGVQ